MGKPAAWLAWPSRQGVARESKIVSAVPCAAIMGPGRLWDTRRFRFPSVARQVRWRWRVCVRAKRSRLPWRRLIHEKLEVKEFTDDTPFTAMGLD